MGYSEVVPAQRVRDALTRLNPELPTEALEVAFRRLTRPEGATLEPRNRAFRRTLVDGVTVEYRTDDGAVRGAQARVVDFEDAETNDWLAVNQFTVTETQSTRRADIVLFHNGLPLGVIELKTPPTRTPRRAQYRLAPPNWTKTRTFTLRLVLNL